MDASELALEITRLKIRCELHEAMLAKLTCAMWLQIPGITPQRVRAEALGEFESIAEGLAKVLFSSPNYAAFDDSEKAMYHDEMREIVEHVKTYVDLLTKKR
jgi:hypothetical protein